LKGDQAIGSIVIYKAEPGTFPLQQMASLQNFATQAVIAIENARLFNETKEALERQTATADILKVIAGSPDNVQPVFEAIAEQSNRLIEGLSTAVYSIVDDTQHLMAFTRSSPEADAALQASFPRPMSSVTWANRIRNGEIVQVPDIEATVEWAEQPVFREMARLRGFRGVLFVPLLRDGATIGLISITRKQPGTFAPHHVNLLQTFADQAVIAIENARLFDEVQARTRDLSEALTYQTGSGNILKVIASSPTNVGPVLETIVENACEVCEAYDAIVVLRDGDDLRTRAHHGPIPLGRDRWPNDRTTLSGRSIADRATVHLRDVLSDEGAEFPTAQEMCRRDGVRTQLAVPMLREGEAIGAIVLRRTEVNPFTDKQLVALRTFADQAVIAIGNVRLFEEVQAKTRDLSEALTYQTGSANILRVIASSPTDVKPVLEAIVESACELCEAYDAIVLLKVGDNLELSAHHGHIPVIMTALPVSSEWTGGLAVLVQRPIHVHDVLSSEGDRFPAAQERARAHGNLRTILSVPLLREGESIGVIILRRREVQPFSDKQVTLLQTFADQAVIAIENVRLFEEVQARTKDLQESLQQQTATADVLQVINSSPGDLEPVFAAMLEKATHLCEAAFGILWLCDGEQFRAAALHGVPPAYAEITRTPIRPLPTNPLGRMLRGERLIVSADVADEEPYRAGDPVRRALVDLAGARSVIQVALVKDETFLGSLTVYRNEVRPFSEKQIALLQNFAAQAVIAMENARLFEELRERQAELRVTFDNMGDGVVMFDSDKKLAAWNRNLQEMLDLPDALLIGRPSFAELFRYLTERNEFGSADLEAELSLSLEDTSREMRYERTRPNGRVIEVRRNPVPDGGFVLIYADITERKRAEEAIRLARDAAEKALRELQTAQDRLIQTEKLASLGQLTAGIAHEIKNPLNFVNNFSSLSAELTAELNDLLKNATLTEKMREEVDELTRLLQDNLEKVVQHGKRADSIVKNMLLHSREGSGEQRAADINALVDESLNLAYHGARAERSGFNITLQRDFDASAGSAELFPQEITRALLNLISNGFYAATKRKNDGEAGFEPTLSAVTKGLGNSVEIRIRDNGTGVPAEIKVKIFNHFCTTKPAGEGTGRGLSMSHDIIVKQHGGTIRVNTEPGVFTEFIVTLPRAISVQSPQGSTN
jgi:PAS domain S-box-containing protein